MVKLDKEFDSEKIQKKKLIRTEIEFLRFLTLLTFFKNKTE
jgi:hypothetical protein